MEEEITAAYRKWRTYLYRAAYRLLGDAHAAEDVVQETFVKALLHWDSTRQATVRKWLLFNCKRAAVDWIRKHGTRRQREELFGADPPAIADCYTVEDVVCLRETQREVRAAIRMLAPTGRQIIVLRYWQGKQLQEIAAELHIPLGTVQSRLAWAKHRMDRILVPRPLPPPWNKGLKLPKPDAGGTAAAEGAM